MLLNKLSLDGLWDETMLSRIHVDLKPIIYSYARALLALERPELKKEVSFQHQFGNKGTRADQFQFPYSVAVDLSNRIYLADYNRPVVEIFGKDGTRLGQLNGTFDGAAALTVDHDENVLVIDQGWRVQVFNKSWNLKFTFGESGEGEGQLQDAFGICCDRELNIHIADSGNKRIQVFSPLGAWMRTLNPLECNFGEPVGIAINHEGHYVIVDRMLHKVHIMRHGPIHVRPNKTWGGKGCDQGLFSYPWQVLVLKNGDLLISDASNSRLQVFTSEGKFTREICFQKMEPYGVTVDWDGDVIVPDSASARVLIFGSSEESNC